MAKPNTPKPTKKVTVNDLLNEEAAALAPKNAVVVAPPSAKVDFGLPPGVREWADRQEYAKQPLKGTLAGLEGPACEYRQGMMFLCPCGLTSPANHLASCLVTKLDGGYSRVVVQRALDMQAALVEAGYPLECLPTVSRPPRLPHSLLTALSADKTTEWDMIMWVLDEEDRVANQEFGDYEAYCRTPKEAAVVVGPNRQKIMKGGEVTQLARLPWQTPLMMLWHAETERRKLPEWEKEDEKFKPVYEKRWKVILQEYYQKKAVEASQKAKAARAAQTPGAESVMPDVKGILGNQESPESQEGSTGENEEDPPPPGKTPRPSGVKAPPASRKRYRQDSEEEEEDDEDDEGSQNAKKRRATRSGVKETPKGNKTKKGGKRVGRGNK